MSNYIIKGRVFTYRHIWFEEEPNIEEIMNMGGVDVCIFHGVKNCKDNPKFSITKQNTLLLNLGEDEEVLWSGLNKTAQKQIRRSRREDTRIKNYEANSITEDLLKTLADVHNLMYVQKGINGHSINLSELRGYIRYDALLLTIADVSNSKIYHVYVKNGEKSRLLLSCSLFREKDKNGQNMIGRANKLLHWEDITYLRNQGCKWYDWGGISSFDSPNGIDKFKMAFGGIEETYYNVVVYSSLKAKLINNFKK